jgi:ribulose-phosphate 3-epimerase
LQRGLQRRTQLPRRQTISAARCAVGAIAACVAMRSELLIAPSILSADFCRLGEELRALEAAGADWAHVDVMDGRFVPNLTLGPPIVAALRGATKLPLDVHLMMVEPERYVDAFASAGADIISVHAEACVHLHRTLNHIRGLGKKAGVVLNPSSSEESIRYVLANVDLVLIMTVNPGFGGQSFIHEMLPKIRAVRNMIDNAGHKIHLEVDGGVALSTISAVRAAGADVCVAGNAVFKSEVGNYAEAIAQLKRAAAP